MNRVTLIGYLTADPEIRRLPDGAQVANLRLATNERWTDRQTGEIKERAEFHRLVVFNDGLVSKVIQPYARKGKQVMIEGQLRTRKWTGQDGTDHWTTEVVISGYGHDFRLLGPAPATDAREPEPARRDAKAPALNDDIPF